MKRIDLSAEIREEKGTRGVRNLRKSGYLPAVLYGGGKDTLSLKLDRKTLIPVLHRIGEENVFINLKISPPKNTSSEEAKPSDQLTMLKLLQHNPVTDELIHLDFQRISLKKKIVTELHIALVGEPKGIKDGGILDHSLRTIEVEALPQDMPEHIEVDISELNIGETIHVSDVPVTPNVKILTDLERGVLSILAPRKVEEIEEEAEEVEPEVAGKEKKAEKGGKEGAEAEGEKKAEKPEEPSKEKGTDKEKKKS